MKDLMIIGKIVGAHGVHGEFKIFPITDDARRFSSLSEMILLSPNEKPIKPIKIRNSREAGSNILCSAEGIDDRDAAFALIGHYVSVPRSLALTLPEDRFFIADLVGCNVRDDEKGALGIVSEVLQQAGADVFVIKRDDKKDLLIPFLKKVVYRVDIDGREIYVRLPDGLYEIYES